LAANFSTSDDFFSRGVTEGRGVGEGLAGGFFGVAFAVGCGVDFGVAFGVAFGVTVGTGVGRGVGVEVAAGAGVVILISLSTGGILDCSSGDGSSAEDGVSVGSGAFGVGATATGTTALIVSALPLIQTTSGVAGFFALPLHRARPNRTTAWTTPMIAALRQKLALRLMV
jgi:hypothetical protein